MIISGKQSSTRFGHMAKINIFFSANSNVEHKMATWVSFGIRFFFFEKKTFDFRRKFFRIPNICPGVDFD